MHNLELTMYLPCIFAHIMFKYCSFNALKLHLWYVYMFYGNPYSAHSFASTISLVPTFNLNGWIRLQHCCVIADMDYSFEVLILLRIFSQDQE